MPPSNDVPTGFKLYYESPAVRAGVWRDLIIDVWLGPGSVTDLRAMRSFQQNYLRKPEARFAALTIIRIDQLKSFDDDIRREMETGRELLNAKQKCAAIVMPQTGFSVSLVRGILAGLMLFKRPGFPHRVFESVDEAFRWTIPHLDTLDGRTVSLDELRAVHRALMPDASRV